jgi:apocytochrome f
VEVEHVFHSRQLNTLQSMWCTLSCNVHGLALLKKVDAYSFRYALIACMDDGSELSTSQLILLLLTRIVEPIVLGMVLGLLVISILGLLVSAVGHWALASRISMLLVVVASAVPAWPINMPVAYGFPAFAQQLYTFPIDPTGKVACYSCHLAEGPVRVSSPKSVFPGSTFDLLVEIPTIRGLEQIGPAGDLAALNVGGILVLPEGFQVAEDADRSMFSTYSAELPHVLVFGPEPVSRAATLVVNLRVPKDATINTYSIIIAGNRGRGQLYPDGTPSNNSGIRSTVDGWITRIHTTRDSSNMLCWAGGTEELYVSGLPAGVNLLRDNSWTLGTKIVADGLLVSNPNAGGVGQAELALVVQSTTRIRYLGLLLFSVAGTQLALVLKKKQYERYQLQT